MCSAELFRYTIVTQVDGVSYGGGILKEEEFEETNFVKILQLNYQINHLEVIYLSSFNLQRFHKDFSISPDSSSTGVNQTSCYSSKLAKSPASYRIFFV